MVDIRQVMWLSLYHLTEEVGGFEAPTDKWLMNGDTSLMAAVPAKDSDQHPLCLRAAFTYARVRGCKYVVFDTDIRPIPGLVTYEWQQETGTEL